ncbi:MAG TPA: hypothetical protein VLL05_06320 [Terriglobales bacterium]|nr:hypothetical protein [Terriglobales bacterium]
MQTTRWQTSRLLLAGTMGAALVIALPGCRINVDKGAKGEDKHVDIDTPLGGIHVNKDVNARDTGLPVYPGAREKKKESEHDDGHANVNISSGFFGLKVVVIEFLSDDPPEKVTTYYRDQLKKYGGILECHTKNRHNTDPDIEVNPGHDSDKDNKLTCGHDNSGPTIELKVGTKDNQHIVSVTPQDGGKGTDFALVFVQTRGESKDSI